jgi:hypothetical protein
VECCQTRVHREIVYVIAAAFPRISSRGSATGIQILAPLVQNPVCQSPCGIFGCEVRCRWIRCKNLTHTVPNDHRQRANLGTSIAYYSLLWGMRNAITTHLGEYLVIGSTESAEKILERRSRCGSWASASRCRVGRGPTLS